MADDAIVVVAAISEEGHLGVPGGDSPLPIARARRPR